MSNPADRVPSTPPTNTPRPPDGLIDQQRKRARALKRIAKLRKRAAAEIERLLAFLDACDPYTSTELEEAADDGPCDDNELEPALGAYDRMTDQSKAWRKVQGQIPAEDDAEVDDSDSEPSLGSVEDHPNPYRDASDVSGHGRSQERWAAGNRDDREGDEHDGCEEDAEGDDDPDAEPSLGWTVDDCIGNTSAVGYDYEGTSGEEQREASPN